MLIFLKLRIKNEIYLSSEKYIEKCIPVYLSWSIKGDLLFRHPLWNNDADLKLLDNDNVTKLILYSLLVNPEDAKEDNFIVQEKEGKLVLVSIDNYHGFLPCSTDYEANQSNSRVDSNLVLKNLIFCIPLMNEIIPDNIKQKFIHLLNDEKLLNKL